MRTKTLTHAIQITLWIGQDLLRKKPLPRRPDQAQEASGFLKKAKSNSHAQLGVKVQEMQHGNGETSKTILYLDHESKHGKIGQLSQQI